jgi:hypothetical protein
MNWTIVGRLVQLHKKLELTVAPDAMFRFHAFGTRLYSVSLILVTTKLYTTKDETAGTTDTVTHHPGNVLAVVFRTTIVPSHPLGHSFTNVTSPLRIDAIFSKYFFVFSARVYIYFHFSGCKFSPKK